ncbi:Na+ dependent nucleoside transporter C-terminus-domain-containing protein [Thamnidium elegans]|uniref:Sodium/nucleoside cotransporter n=1 Tax=Thamnidium elegans TaxID=101142 RepID=A0A8H7VXA2_9FUNG|nr:hypothetical protein INT48_006719 [Thamnidium elegans]KAI8094003.1 Na+ dependent nucleoside transporter C-terminus-domain-containing protein [Thamnidium elegans]
MSNNDISTNENGLFVGATQHDDSGMVHRVHTSLTEEGDVKQKPSEKESATTVNIPSTIDEKAEVYSDSEGEDEEKKPSKFSLFYQKHLPWFHALQILIVTGFVAAAFALQVPKGYSQENLILGLVYAFFILYRLFDYVSSSHVTTAWMKCVRFVGAPIMRLPKHIRSICYAIFVTAVIVVTIFSLPESEHSSRVERVIALFGIVVFLGVLYITSNNRKAVNWNTICSSILIQFLLALFVFRTSVGNDIFKWASGFAQTYLSKAKFGTAFVFGDVVADSGIFAVSVFPTLIFFAATVQILYYYGALQWLLQKSAVFFVNLLQVSGAESVVAVASPFLGLGENALLVKPFLPLLTKSEMHQVLTSGFATISGSVLYGYIAMGVDGQALLTSCIMSIPGAITVSKLRIPEDDIPVTARNIVVPPSDEKPANALHAAGFGAAIGVNIALSIMANLISLLALLYAVNAFLTWLGNFVYIQELTLQLITGYVFVPVAWLMGVDNNDLVIVGRLLATKIWANEFVAYQELASIYKELISYRSYIITTYALCGFANLSSVGMQIGVMGTLAPTRSADIAKLAISSMICGAFSTWISAAIAGMLI